MDFFKDIKHHTGLIERVVLFVVVICLVSILLTAGCNKLSGNIMGGDPDEIVIEDAQEDVTVDYDKTDEIIIEDAEEEKTEEELIEDIIEKTIENEEEKEETEIDCSRYIGDWFIHIQEGGEHIWNEVRIHDCEYNIGNKTYTGKAESLMAYVPVPQLGMKTVALGGYFGDYTVSGSEITIIAENGSSTFHGVFIHENLAVGTWVNNNSGAGGVWSCFRTSSEFQDYLDEIVEEDLEQYDIDMEALEGIQQEMENNK